ncbi:MAG: LCP family protein [Tissierellia bacterium]|nr:LCP family protein [Tissierellia bacterium]MDD4780805.1 LCP family protein [Tissierellia bacterium]
MYLYIVGFHGNVEALEDPNATPLEKAINKKGRINVLLLGLEHERSDTIMVATYDTKEKKADIISIPRDTYVERDGFVNSANNKINTIYTVKGIEGIKDMVRSLTGITVDKYVTIDYDGVRAAVDAVGGVDVNVPFHMRYTDPYSDPPLDINIPEGEQTIYGDQAMEFLRFRKTNYPGYTGYAEGDLGRIQAQQDFVKSAIKKSLSLKLPKVISSIYPHVDTDFSLTELTSLAVGSIGFSSDNVDFHTLPGDTQTLNRLSFYIANDVEVMNLIYEIYDISEENKIE